MRALFLLFVASIAWAQGIPFPGFTVTTAPSTFTVTGAAVSNGTTACTSPVSSGATTTCTLTPATNYYSVSASSDTCGGSLVANTYTTGAVTSNCIVTAVFMLLVSDNFNRTDANPIGGNWTTVPTLAAFQILSNVAQATASGAGSESYWNANTFGANQCSQATMGSHFQVTAVAVRASSTQNTLYYFRANNSAYQVGKLVNATRTQLGTNYANAADGDVLKLCVSGSTLTPYINGVAQATQTDSAIASGQPGMYAVNTGTLDNWSAWELP